MEETVAVIELSLTLNEVNACLVALSKLPYEQSAGVIDKIRDQTIRQVQPPAEPTAE